MSSGVVGVQSCIDISSLAKKREVCVIEKYVFYWTSPQIVACRREKPLKRNIFCLRWSHAYSFMLIQRREEGNAILTSSFECLQAPYLCAMDVQILSIQLVAMLIDRMQRAVSLVLLWGEYGQRRYVPQYVG